MTMTEGTETIQIVRDDPRKRDWGEDLSVRNGHGPTTSSDPTVDALDALGDALDGVASDQQILSQRVQMLRESRASGVAWLEILTSERGDGSMQLVSQLLARISGASGVLRKVVVEELRHEGVSIPTIAKLFGVSHQRVSNLLRRDPS